jgi:NADH-quinone oxidoreductase subunit J
VSFSGELLVLICGTAALLSAVGTVALRTPLRAAMSLLAHILSLAGLYLTLNAHLLAVIQMLVYAGAVVVLFVFVIMLIGPSAIGSVPDQRGLVVKTIGSAVLAMTMGSVAMGVSAAGNDLARPELPLCDEGTAECNQFGGVDALSEAIYVQGAIPFELVSMLLLIAILSAMAVARGAAVSEKVAIDKAHLPVRPTVLDPPRSTLGPDAASIPSQEAAE